MKDINATASTITTSEMPTFQNEKGDLSSVRPKGQKRGWGSWGWGGEPSPHQLGSLGSTVSSSSGVRDRAPAIKRFLLYSKCSGWLLLLFPGSGWVMGVLTVQTDNTNSWLNGPVKMPKSVARPWSGGIPSSGDSKQHRRRHHVILHVCCLLFCSPASMKGAGVHGADGRQLAVTRYVVKQVKLIALN